MQTKKEINNLINRIVELDRTKSLSVYEISKLITAIHDQKLYEILGYEDFAFFVNNKLPFTVSTAHKYIELNKFFKHTKFKKEDCLKLISEFGYTVLTRAFQKNKSLRTVSQIRKWKKEEDRKQLNFSLTKEDYELAVQVLKNIYGDNIILPNAFMLMIKEHNLKKVA